MELSKEEEHILVRKQVAFLKEVYKEEFGIQFDSSKDYADVAREIKKITKQHITEKSLRNFWTEKDPKHVPNKDTREILIGAIKKYSSWKHFARIYNTYVSKEHLFDPEAPRYKVEDMKESDEFIVGWYPQHYAKLYYQGFHKFKVLQVSDDFKLKVGDIIEVYGFGLEYKPVSPDLENYLDKNDDAPSGYPLLPTIIFKTKEEYVSKNENYSLKLSI